MDRQSKLYGYFTLPLLTTLVLLVSPAIAQEQDPPPIPEPSTPTATQPADPAKDPATKPADDAVGKSKLEKETGTVNDRIFEVLPNYGTVESNKTPPPLRTGQKYRLATAAVFDWASYPFNGVLAGIAQAKDDPKAYGQGWGAYGKRFSESFADNSIGTYMTTAVFPGLLHEDPRYYELRGGSFTRRTYYAFNRLFVTRADSGQTRFNYSEFVGNATAAAISNAYHPAEDRTASRNATTFAFLILYDGLSNELKEFWPDIRRKVFHKNNP